METFVELAKDVFQITGRFPREVAFTLVNQITRSAISIPSNIAEGAGRASKKEFSNFISIALGSVSELETQLYLARELKFPVDPAVFLKIESVGKMLVMLRRKLRQG